MTWVSKRACPIRTVVDEKALEQIGELIEEGEAL
jgi:nitrogen regulatory protein PII-like uncharacterized protein